MVRIALTRAVSPAIVHCELTHLERTPIDVDVARRQHEAYEQALAGAGYVVTRLPASDDMPDSVFIEDTAIVLDDIAVITRPGAASRRRELAAVEAALAAWRPIARIDAPGTVDGGDVLTVGRQLFVGQSSRTNREGIAQLHDIVQRHGYEVVAVDVTGCLHLKSAVTAAGPEAVLLNPAWVAKTPFARFDIITVHPDEPAAANLVSAGRTLIYPTAFPRTQERLEQRGYAVTTVDVSELAKAEGAVTCCSLLFKAPEARTELT
jgi:dimethylargininase